MQLVPFFEEVASKEDWGHVGYHGSNQAYRIYQDIIRFVLEEVVAIPVRQDFHFLRIPGDIDLNLNSIDEFYAFWGKWDNKGLRGKQLLSLNFGIYSNFDDKGSCSLNLFVKDSSKSQVNYTAHLTPLFVKLGLPSTAPAKLMAIGKKWLDDEGGILLRISERSHIDHPKHEVYTLIDEQGYPAKKGGSRYGDYPLSNHYDRIMTSLYLQKKLDIAPQFRLLINNRYTLNPFSQYDVERYDLYDPALIAGYEAEMRTYVRTLLFDAKKVEKYKSDLLQLWQ